MPALTVSGNEITDVVRAAALSGDGVASPDSSFGILPAVTNLVPNGGFETNTTGINVFGSVATRDTAFSKFGAASLKVVTNGAGNPEGVIENIAVAAGTTCTMSVWARGSGTIRAQLNDGSVATLSSTLTLSSTFQKLQVTATVSAGRSSFDIRVETNATQAITFWIDGWQLETGSIAHPYVETNGATATRAASRIRIDTGLFDETQFAVAFRIHYGFPSSSPPGANAYLLDWRDDANNLLGLYFDIATKKWTAARLTGGAGGSAVSAAQTFAAQDATTVIFACTATQVKVSVGGAAFVAAANTSIPTLAAALADLGSKAGTAGWLDGRCKWATLFVGTLADADAATLNALGSTDPTFATLPDTAKVIAVLPMATTAYNLKTRQSYTTGLTCSLSVRKRPRLARARTVTIGVAPQKTCRLSRPLTATVTPGVHKRIRKSRPCSTTIGVAVSKYTRLQPNKFLVNVSFLGGGVHASKRIRKTLPLGVAIAPAAHKRIRKQHPATVTLAGALQRRVRVHRALTAVVVAAASKAGHRTHRPTTSSTGRIRRSGTGGTDS